MASTHLTCGFPGSQPSFRWAITSSKRSPSRAHLQATRDSVWDSNQVQSSWESPILKQVLTSLRIILATQCKLMHGTALYQLQVSLKEFMVGPVERTVIRALLTSLNSTWTKGATSLFLQLTQFRLKLDSTGLWPLSTLQVAQLCSLIGWLLLLV